MGGVPLMAALPTRNDLESELMKALGKVDRATRKRILDALGDPPKVDNLTSDLWNEVQTAYQQAVMPTLESAFVSSAERLSNSVGVGMDWTLMNQRASDWSRQYAYDLIRGMNDNSRNMVQQAVSDFYSGAIDNAHLQTRLSRVYGPKRAETIAITEVTRASVQGDAALVDELDKAGMKMTAIWDTAADDAVCPICSPIDGKERGDGWNDLPPAHPRCRCSVHYEVVTEGGALDAASSASATTAVEELQQPTVAIDENVKIPRLLDPQLKARLQDSLDAIDNVHSVPEMPRIPFTSDNNDPNLGGYTYDGKNAVEITVRNWGNDHLEFTATHELGHFIDHQGIGTPGTWTSNEGAVGRGVLKDWWQSVEKSPEFQRLLDMRMNPEKYTYTVKDPIHGMVTQGPSASYIAYLMEAPEFWARSYSQYIALESGNASLASQLAAEQIDPYYGRQWSTESFGPIKEQIDKLLQTLGWKK